MAATTEKEGLKFVSMDSGALLLMMDGLAMMPGLLVDSWALQP